MRSRSDAPARAPLTSAPTSLGGASLGVLALDARGRVVAADGAALAVLGPGTPPLERGVELAAALHAAGEGTAALAVANALADRGGEVTFTVHDASGAARARWRLLPLPAAPSCAAEAAAWIVTMAREPAGRREGERAGATGGREAEALAAVARELARAGDDGSAAFAELARGARALFEAAGACVVAFDKGAGGATSTLRVAAAAGILEPLAGHVTRPMREPSLFGDVARGRDVVVVNDAATDARVDPRYGGPFMMRQVLAAPLLVDDAVAAVLCVVNVPSGAFGASDVDLARRLADHGALALRNVRLLAARALAQARAEAAAAIARAALDADGAAAGAAAILAELDRVAPTNAKLLSVADRERGTLRCVAAVGAAAGRAGDDWAFAEALRHDELARGEIVDVPDVRAALAAAGRPADAAPEGGAVLVPIMTRGMLVGDVCVPYAFAAPVGADALETLRMLAPSVGVAMDVLVREDRERARGDEERRRDDQLRQAEKLAALGELVAGVAHEMNNPLTGISAFAELLLEEPEGATFAGENREAVRFIKREADRATAVVRDLLTFARESAPAWGPVALDALLDRTVRVRAYAARTAGVDLRLDVDPGLPPVRGDERKLQQVFINLIANAEHAVRTSPPGARRVTVHARRAGSGRVVVRVSDTGPGVPTEVLGRVFEPFFTTKPPGEGTGLGLSVSYGIVQAHGGELRAHNLPEGGAAFDVAFPVDPAAR